MTTYFLTVCAHMHTNRFQRTEVAELMISKLLEYRDSGEFQVHEFVVMPDHIHVLLSLSDGCPLSRAVQLIKGGFSRALHQQGISPSVVWEPRYHDRRVRDMNEFAEIALYIKNNPARRGLVGEATAYPYSSAARRERLDPAPGLKPQTGEKILTRA